MAYQVVLSPRAVRDLEEIVRFISRDNPQAAERFGKLLIEKARYAGSFPLLGRIVPEFDDPKIREIIVKSYRIVYRVNDEAGAVQVARFWHAARGTLGFVPSEE